MSGPEPRDAAAPDDDAATAGGEGTAVRGGGAARTPSGDDAEAGLEAAREQARRDFAREQAETRRGPSAEMRRGYARGRARDEAIRAGLTPLGPDERPLGLKLAIALVLLICGANAVLAATDDHLFAAVAFAVGGLALAAGLWARIYLVVVLVEALLAIGLIFAAIALLFAGSVAEAAFALAVLVLGGPVFWLLVRVMARLQVPRQ